MPFSVIFQPPATAGEGKYKPQDSAISALRGPPKGLPRRSSPTSTSRKAANCLFLTTASRSAAVPAAGSPGLPARCLSWRRDAARTRRRGRPRYGFGRFRPPAPTARHPSAQGHALGTAFPMNFSALKGPNNVTLQATGWSDAVCPGRWPGLRNRRPFGPPQFAFDRSRRPA